MSKNILVTSGKGGTGKSMFCVNMAYILAENGSRVLLLDCDYGHGSLDIYLGVQDSCIYNLDDVMKRTCALTQAVVATDEPGLMFMAASPDEEPVMLDKQVMTELEKIFDYIIIDGPASMAGSLELAKTASRTVMVSTCEYASVRATDRFDMMARHEGIRNRTCVLNKVRTREVGTEGYLSFDDIKELMRTPVIGIIPYFDDVEPSLNTGRPIVRDKDPMVVDNFKKICERIINRKL